MATPLQQRGALQALDTRLEVGRAGEANARVDVPVANPWHHCPVAVRRGYDRKATVLAGMRMPPAGLVGAGAGSVLSRA